MPGRNAQYARRQLSIVTTGLGVIRRYANEKHHKPIDSYAELFAWMVMEIERLDRQVSKYADAITKAENDKTAWKNYANSEHSARLQAERQRDAVQTQLDNLPPQPDAQDVAAADAVNNAPDDLPAADTATGAGGGDTTVVGGGGVDTTTGATGGA